MSGALTADIERIRLLSLESYRILDSMPEEEYDRIGIEQL